MNELKAITANGVSLKVDSNGLTPLAFQSLRIGLQAYFATYQDADLDEFLFNEDGTHTVGKSSKDFNYIRDYFETIVHIQHFAELICKDFLRLDHPLLVIDASDKIEIFYKLLHGENIDSKEFDNLRSFEFTKALNTACTLAKKNTPTNSLFRMFKKWEKVLKELNNLRNRLWHRGTFILEYHSLDDFMCNYILPFINDIISHQIFINNEFLWRHQKLSCGIDPFTCLIHISKKKTSHRVEKIAFLKELGRAAYANPIFSTIKLFSPDYDEFKERAELKVAYELENGMGTRIFKCPTCGTATLLAMPGCVNCELCSLNIGEEIGYISLREFGIDDVWFPD